MRPHGAWPVIWLFVSGCPAESPGAIVPADTETDGNIEGTAPYPGGSSDEGAGAYSGCLQFPSDGEFGFQHQCGGQANIQVNLRGCPTGNCQEFARIGPV
jgi:hypothetical protein